MSSPKAIAPEQDTTKPEGSSATAKGAAAAAAAAAAAEAPPSPSPSPSPAPAPAGRNKAFRAKKEALSLTATAVERLRELLESESGPRLIRIGVRNKGCAGMSYHLEYVTPDQAGKFDERVKQDGVEVLIDSKALFSIIGSEMDWQEDRLSAKFVFNNPNVKESCGCGESFLT